MDYKYSPSQRGFYREDFHGDRIPEDAVAVSPEEHARLLQGEQEGLEIVPGEGGYPILRARVYSPEQLAFTARYQRNLRLSQADANINRIEDEAGDTTAWRQYRKALRDWPASAGFPDLATMPAAPK